MKAEDFLICIVLSFCDVGKLKKKRRLMSPLKTHYFFLNRLERRKLLKIHLYLYSESKHLSLDRIL